MRAIAGQSTPPDWADSVLHLLLKPEDRDSVSGDLLEEYRELLRAGCDRPVADRWYLRQVAGFVWRAAWWWGGLLAMLSIGRDALDWFNPPASFYARSLVTTWVHVALFAGIGFTTVWRGRSLFGAAAVGLAAQMVATGVIFVSTILLIGVWHDPGTLNAIEQSGGIAEAFSLPLVVLAPAALLSMLGGALASVVRGSAGK